MPQLQLFAEQVLRSQSACFKTRNNLHYRPSPRLMPRAMAPDPGMKSLGPSSGQLNSRINDQLAASTSQPMLSPSLPVQPSIPRSYSVSLFDALKFNGPAPEVINCRLAMVGFLYAASNEASSGKLVLEQFQDSPWFPLAFSIVFIWASLVPITKGAKRESFGWFSPRAELTNGRTACLAFAVLLLLEYKSGVAFF